MSDAHKVIIRREPASPARGACARVSRELAGQHWEATPWVWRVAPSTSGTETRSLGLSHARDLAVDRTEGEQRR